MSAEHEFAINPDNWIQYDRKEAFTAGAAVALAVGAFMINAETGLAQATELFVALGVGNLALTGALLQQSFTQRLQ